MSDLNGWHLDKRVPVTLVVVILLQTGAAIWWAASINARVAAAELIIAARGPVIERFVRTENSYFQLRDELLSRLDLMSTDFDRLEDKVDRLIENAQPRRAQQP